MLRNLGASRTMLLLLLVVVVATCSYYLGYQSGSREVVPRADAMMSDDRSRELPSLVPGTTPASSLPVDASSTKPLSLEEAMNGTGTDKFWRHKYHHYYQQWLAKFRTKPGFKLLEIGAEKGRSLHAWNTYFPNAEVICGLAYGHATEGVEDRAQGWSKVQVLRGDQGKSQTLQLLIDKGPWDVIIDDGSHFPPHMVSGFFMLWNSINPGGLYIVEDLATNYWPDGMPLYGYKISGRGIANGPDLSAVAKFQQFVHVLSKFQIGAPELSIMRGDDYICSIEWGRNIVAFKRCSDDEWTDRPPLMGAHYDKQIMDDWLQEAKKTNPF